MNLAEVKQEDPPGSGIWGTVWEGEAVAEVRAAKVPNPAKEANLFRIRIQTPVRLRLKQSLVKAESLTVAQFLEAVERRSAMLGKLHGVGTPSRGVAARWAERVREVERELVWRDWERYSNRQQAKVPMGGVAGEWVWETGEDWDGWNVLWQGQWLNAGKGTSMGLGRYRVEPL